MNSPYWEDRRKREQEEKEMKFNEQSKLTVTVVDGKRYIVDGEISLGSIMKPNRKIKSFSYDIPKMIGTRG
jgi:hypothetical protein